MIDEISEFKKMTNKGLTFADEVDNKGSCDFVSSR
jgi:hypothetical protein